MEADFEGVMQDKPKGEDESNDGDEEEEGEPDRLDQQMGEVGDNEQVRGGEGARGRQEVWRAGPRWAGHCMRGACMLLGCAVWAPCDEWLHAAHLLCLLLTCLPCWCTVCA